MIREDYVLYEDYMKEEEVPANRRKNSAYIVVFITVAALFCAFLPSFELQEGIENAVKFIPLIFFMWLVLLLAHRTLDYFTNPLELHYSFWLHDKEEEEKEAKRKEKELEKKK